MRRTIPETQYPIFYENYSYSVAHTILIYPSAFNTGETTRRVIMKEGKSVVATTPAGENNTTRVDTQ